MKRHTTSRCNFVNLLHYIESVQQHENHKGDGMPRKWLISIMELSRRWCSDERLHAWIRDYVASGRADLDFRRIAMRYVKRGDASAVVSQCSIRNRFGCSDTRDKDLAGVYWDSWNGLVLEFRNIPIAIVGFHARGDHVVIEQLQGIVHGVELGMQDLRWERLLVEFVTHMSRLAAFREIWIITASASRWYSKRDFWFDPDQVTDREENDHREHMRMRYDVTARRMKFVMREDHRFWSKPLRGLTS
jgi:hypothetical protein